MPVHPPASETRITKPQLRPAKRLLPSPARDATPLLSPGMARTAKFAFASALAVFALLAATTATSRDEFLQRLLVAPVQALALTGIVLLCKGIVFGWDSERSPPGLTWAVWPFLVGCVLGLILVAVLISIFELTAGQALAAVTLVPLVGLASAMIVVVLVATLSELRRLSRKIYRAGRNEEELRRRPPAARPTPIAEEVPRLPTAAVEGVTDRPANGAK